MKRILLASCFALLGLSARLHADTTLVFNEIMYHPATNESVLEWVEFHNQMAVSLDISSWSVTGGIDYTFPEGTVVTGGGFVVVALSPDDLMAQLGITGVLGPFTGRLSNNGNQLRLRNNSRRVVDEVNYGVSGKWPVAPDGFGVSLAKRDRNTASGPARNWTVSDQINGTPGADNFPNLGIAPPVTGLVAVESAWKYEASGADQGTAWRQSTFNDDAWATGTAWFYSGTVTAGDRRPIPSLFNTGVDANGNVIAPGNPDPHYILSAGAQGTPGAAATVTQNHPNWLANDLVSSWIGVVPNGATSIATGGYNYRTSFNLANNALPSSVEISFNVAVDNNVTNVLLNGAYTGKTNAGFTAFSQTFTLNSGAVPGNNTLEFQTVNEGPGPGGFRALVSGSALVITTNTALLSGSLTRYFRQDFDFTGNPAVTQLKLNAIVDDGAIFYLNGEEVYRFNMPDTLINHTTPASSIVSTPAYTGFVTISPAFLKPGSNVLAVEVHQATGGEGSMLFGAELTATTVPGSALPLAFNEFSASTNAEFFLELLNFGNNPLDLTGYRIVRDGLTNQIHVLTGPEVFSGGDFLTLTETMLGFKPEDGDRLLLVNPAGVKVIDGAVLTKGPRARYPDGDGPWLRPAAATPGAPNNVALHDEIVINEIMYHHRPANSVEGGLPQTSNEAWLELYNRSGQTVDLTGWQLSDGVDYDFTTGTMMAPGEYLVVAKDAAALRLRYPGVRIVGNYGGQLSHGGERIVLEDANGNPADVVEYLDRGRWPKYADGGGSSLELRDPDADNAVAEAWAPSDESGKSDWQTFTYRMTANIPNNSGQPTTWQDFIMGLLADGECYIDDLSVIENPDTAPSPIVANGDFQNGITGWRVLGTHSHSRVVAEPGNPGNEVLHMIATGAQEHMHNHVEATLIAGKTITNGREYEVSFRAKWLTGNNLLNTRLYFNRAAHSTELPTPQLNGTPGSRNSRFEPNIGPVFGGLHHERTVPAASEPVTVSVSASDADGLGAVELWWSRDGGAWESAAMTGLGGGRFQGTIPGYPAGSVVQFYTRAVDGLGAAATFPAAGPESGALYIVEDGQALLDLAHNVRIVMTRANTDLLHGTAQGVNQTNVMSNDLLPCTIIYNEHRAYYDCGVHLRGSQRGRYSDVRTGFHIEFPADDLFRGVHPVMLIDRSGAGDATSNRQEEIVLKHILNRAGGIPGTYSEICRVIAPRAAHTGPAQFFPRHEDVFLETAFDNGGDGTMFEMELIYYPTTADADGYKRPQPDSVIGTDITNLGDDKEIYRYNFMIKHHRDQDNYRSFIALAKAWSLEGAALEEQTGKLMDIDQWMRAYALVSLCSVGDMYTFGNNHNFFMYTRPSDGKFLYFPWDMDFVFTRGSSGALVGNQNLGKIVNIPSHLRLLYAHMLDIIGISFNTAYMSFWTDHYDNFAPGQNYAGSLSTIGARATFVQNAINSAGGNGPFTVDGPDTIETDSNLVTFTGTAPVQIKTIKVNGTEFPVVWHTLTGWTLQVPLSASNSEIEITGYDLRDQPLTNFTRTVTINYTGPLPDPQGLVGFNEIMYHPTTPNASFIELFNRSADVAFDLSGWIINGLDYTFPQGSIMTAGQHLVLAKDLTAFSQAYGETTPVFGVFDGKLDIDGETLTLIKPQTNGAPDIVIDKVHYEAVAPWAATPNGQGTSLQVIDPEQDNSRASNWSDGLGWRYYSFTGVAGSGGTRLFMWLTNVGDVFLDDIHLVQGEVAEAGPNILMNGGFESGALSPWTATGNHAGSMVTSEVAHRGNYGVHVIATGIGSAVSTLAQLNLVGVDTTSPYTLSFYYLPASVAGLQYRLTSFFRNVQPLDISPILFTPGAANTSNGTLPPYDAVWLNEVQPDNASGITDNAGEHDPWVELFNHSAAPISLEGYYLADNYQNNLTQWAFPAGATINPGEFKVVWVDGQPGQTTTEQLHASFRLTGGTGSLALVRLIDGTPQITDYLNYQGLATDTSYGDFPDGEPFKRAPFNVVTPGAPNIARPADLHINEWMASNQSTLVDPADGNYEDWFELYNAGSEPVDLAGYYLTDNLNNKTQFQIPLGYVIDPGGYLVVWADNDVEQNDLGSPDLHVNFALSQSGESIGLFSPAGIAVDEVTFGQQTNDVSQGRFPDGMASLPFFDQPTPGAANTLGAANSMPVITPIDDLTVVAGQAVDFFVAASDAEVPPQILHFSLLPGAPVGASINELTGAFHWAVGPNQIPGIYTITVRVTDDGSPALFDDDTFTITVRSREIEISVDGNNVELALPVVPGHTYRVLTTDNLTPPVMWTPLGDDIVATESTLIIQDMVGENPQRFYSVVEVH